MQVIEKKHSRLLVGMICDSFITKSKERSTRILFLYKPSARATLRLPEQAVAILRSYEVHSLNSKRDPSRNLLQD
jgi:hypothetical protein